jgi:hypothetical protein
MSESESRTDRLHKLAYDRWESQGRRHGYDMEDWLWAEENDSRGATNGQPRDDVSSAPESGTITDPTSGNQPAAPQERPAPLRSKSNKGRQNRSGSAVDDPSTAGEVR